MVDAPNDRDGRREEFGAIRRHLESEFERLRDELAVALERYEGRMAALCDETPVWLDLEETDVRSLFDLEDESLEEPARLGPRLGAVMAGRVEEFFEEWAGSLDESDALEGRELQALVDDARDVEEMLDRVSERISEVVRQGESRLEEIEEEGAEILEEKRQEDVEALEDLVDEGEVETGPDAREERARLWEEQRRRSDALDETVDGIRWLLEVGAETSRAWIEELRALHGEALRGFALSEPELEDFDSWPDSLVDRTSERDGRTGDAERAGREADDSDPVSSDATDERSAEAETAPSQGPPIEMSEESDASGPFLRKPPESDESSRPSRPRRGDDSGSDVEAVPPTQPIDPGRGGVDGEETPPTETADSLPSPSEETDDGSDAEGGGEDRVTDGSEPAEPEPREVTSDSPEEGTADDEEPLEQTGGGEARGPVEETTCLRIESTWQRVDTPTVLAAIGPPAAVLAAFLSMGSAYFFGLDESFNPLAAWPWVQHTVIVAFGWIVAAPLMLGWRPQWEGWRFAFIVERESREESTLRLEEEALVIGSIRLPWDDVERAERMRWESSDESMRGWVLELEPKRFGNITFIASSESGRRWSSAGGPVIEPPVEAWQVDESTLESIHRRAEG